MSQSADRVSQSKIESVRVVGGGYHGQRFRNNSSSDAEREARRADPANDSLPKTLR